MNILVAGASGATGKKLVEQLVQAGQNVKVIIRPTGKDSRLMESSRPNIHYPR